MQALLRACSAAASHRCAAQRRWPASAAQLRTLRRRLSRPLPPALFLLLLLASSLVGAPRGAAAKRTDRSSEAATAPSYAQYLNYTAAQLAAATSNKARASARTPKRRRGASAFVLQICSLRAFPRVRAVLCITAYSVSTWSRRLRRRSPRRR
jgi:hypothetical protein